MPVNINGEEYSMEEIEALCKKKLAISKQVEQLINRLRKEFLNDEKLEERKLLTIKEMEKIEEKYGEKGDIKRPYKTIEGKGRVFLRRDMNELKQEIELIEEIYNLSKKLLQISNIEREYFEKV